MAAPRRELLSEGRMQQLISKQKGKEEGKRRGKRGYCWDKERMGQDEGNWYPFIILME